MAEMVYHRPKLTKYQLDSLFCPERIAIVEASTKSGKTVGALAWLTEQAYLKGAPGRQFWWIAPTFSQAKIAHGRFKRGITPREIVKSNESDLTHFIPNGAILSFKSGEIPDNLYGENVYDAVVDEMTRLREEAWFALRSTLTKTRGRVRMIGNVKGRENWAYKLARKAQSGESDMHYSMINSQMAVDAGILDADEIEAAKRVLPEKIFNELYMCQPSDDGGNPFGINHISECLGPLSDNPPVAFGVDLAKSVDWTVAIGLDRSGAVASFDRFQSPWTETIGRVRSLTQNVPSLVDSTGVGDPVLESLQRGNVPGEQRFYNFEGFKFSSESKQSLMEGLAVGIQQQKLRFPDGPIRTELEAFEYEYTRNGVKYSAPEGMHDDCVCALALAWRRLGAGALRPVASVGIPNMAATQQRPDWMGY